MTSTIPHNHWQPKLGQIGTYVTDLEDIRQGIKTLIMTPKGSVAGDPEKGCNHGYFRDKNILPASKEVAADIRLALERDCPRIDVEDITVEFLPESTVHFEIKYGIAGWIGSELQTLSFSEGFGGVNV